MNTSERMLRLLGLLQTHRYWPGPELAQRLTVSERTLRRDVDRLRALGYDVDAVRGVAGGYQLRAGRALPPLLLDNEEAVAIAVGLRSSAAAALDGGADASVRALTKVVAMLPPALRRRMDAVASVVTMGPQYRPPPIDAETLTRLAAACRDAEYVGFDYVAADGAATQRRVEAHEVVSYAQRWYLVGWDTRRQDWRTFRLDRIRQVTVAGDRFRRREIPGGSGLAHVREGRRHIPRRYDVEVRFETTPEAVRSAVGNWGEIEADGEATRWRIGTDSLEWPVMIVAVIDADATVVSPPELVDLIAGAAARMGRTAQPRS